MQIAEVNALSAQREALVNEKESELARLQADADAKQNTVAELEDQLRNVQHTGDSAVGELSEELTK